MQRRAGHWKVAADSAQAYCCAILAHESRNEAKKRMTFGSATLYRASYNHQSASLAGDSPHFAGTQSYTYTSQGATVERAKQQQDPLPQTAAGPAHSFLDALPGPGPLRSFPPHTNTQAMPPDSSSFTALNCPPDSVLPEYMGLFSLAAPPNTDLWRKPPSRDTSTAPILYTALRNPFIAAEVTVAAEWELEWDQAGLVIFAGAPPGRVATPTTATPRPSEGPSNTPSAPSSTAASNPPAPNTHPTQNAGHQLPPPYMPPAPASKWVKVGLEFCNGACHATSVVATSDGADWARADVVRRPELRVKIERIGCALWVWYEDEVAGWKKLREVTWFFWGVEDKAVRVGVYASRPANFGTSMYERRNGFSTSPRNLCVDFEGLEIF